jgi:hypothetical protein
VCKASDYWDEIQLSSLSVQSRGIKKNGVEISSGTPARAADTLRTEMNKLLRCPYRRKHHNTQATRGDQAASAESLEWFGQPSSTTPVHDVE